MEYFQRERQIKATLRFKIRLEQMEDAGRAQKVYLWNLVCTVQFSSRPRLKKVTDVFNCLAMYLAMPTASHINM